MAWHGTVAATARLQNSIKCKFSVEKNLKNVSRDGSNKSASSKENVFHCEKLGQFFAIKVLIVWPHLLLIIRPHLNHLAKSVA